MRRVVNMHCEPIMILLSAIALLVVLLLAYFGMPFLEAEWRNYYFNRIKWKNEISRNQFRYIDHFFSSRFSYYRRLNHDGRARFIYRALEFKNQWTFDGRDGLEVSEHMEMLVCGAAAQITFGLDYFLLENFEKILLYPSTFHSRLIDAEVKGLTYGNGLIAFSWPDFENGFRINNDGYNLGLHELAHAIDINHEKSYRKDKLNELYFADFLDTAFWEYRKESREIANILDARAKRNEHEFFAVCVEHFFECPELFKEKLPNVFHHLCLVLQQNPLNKENNFKLEERFISEFRENSSRKIPGPIRWINKSRTPFSQVVYTLAIIPGMFYYAYLMAENPHHTEMINWLMIGGGTLFVVMRTRISFYVNFFSLINPMLYVNFFRGFAFTGFAMMVLNSSIWHYSKNVKYRLYEETVQCKNDYCYVRDLKMFNFPEEYRNLTNYQIHNSELELFEASGIKVYLEEHSQRGLFNLILGIKMKVVAGQLNYPAMVMKRHY